jgi:hypothetical protein
VDKKELLFFFRKKEMSSGKHVPVVIRHPVSIPTTTAPAPAPAPKIHIIRPVTTKVTIAAPAGPSAAPAGPSAAPAGPSAAPAGPSAVPKVVIKVPVRVSIKKKEEVSLEDVPKKTYFPILNNADFGISPIVNLPVESKVVVPEPKPEIEPEMVSHGTVLESYTPEQVALEKGINFDISRVAGDKSGSSRNTYKSSELSKIMRDYGIKSTGTGKQDKAKAIQDWYKLHNLMK